MGCCGQVKTERDIAPGQDYKKLPVAPEVAPVVLLRATGFDDEYGFLCFYRR
jgi:hypothetical protein